MNEQQSNETQVEELETLTEELAGSSNVPEVAPNNSVKYEQQANELVNSVTMADLVDPTMESKKKNKKGLVIVLVVIILVLGVTSILFLNDGTFSKILGITTTSELDVFKTDIVNTTSPENDKEYGTFRKEGNRYIFDISNAGNGVRIKYYLSDSLTAYIKFADDFDTTKNFTFNLNMADYYIEDTNPGELSLIVEPDYIVFLNSNNQENQVILSKRGIKLEEDPAYDPEKISTTTATTTTTTRQMIHKDFTFENTTDAEGRTTRVLTEYDPVTDKEVDFTWIDEDGTYHYVFYGTEESRQVHPELYTTTTTEPTIVITE